MSNFPSFCIVEVLYIFSKAHCYKLKLKQDDIYNVWAEGIFVARQTRPGFQTSRFPGNYLLFSTVLGPSRVTVPLN